MRLYDTGSHMISREKRYIIYVNVPYLFIQDRKKNVVEEENEESMRFKFVSGIDRQPRNLTIF